MLHVPADIIINLLYNVLIASDQSTMYVLSGRGARQGHQNFMNSCGVKVGTAALLITIVGHNFR